MTYLEKVPQLRPSRVFFLWLWIWCWAFVPYQPNPLIINEVVVVIYNPDLGGSSGTCCFLCISVWRFYICVTWSYWSHITNICLYRGPGFRWRNHLHCLWGWFIHYPSFTVRANTVLMILLRMVIHYSLSLLIGSSYGHFHHLGGVGSPVGIIIQSQICCSCTVAVYNHSMTFSPFLTILNRIMDSWSRSSSSSTLPIMKESPWLCLWGSWNPKHRILIVLSWQNFQNVLLNRVTYLIYSKWNIILQVPSSIWDISNHVLIRCPRVVGIIPCSRIWLICAVPWKFIGHGRSIPNYFCGVYLYGSGCDCISPSLCKILLYRHFLILLICWFLMVFSLCFYYIYLHNMNQIICHIRLHARVISTMCLDQLEAILLSAVTSSLSFPSSCFK